MIIATGGTIPCLCGFGHPVPEWGFQEGSTLHCDACGRDLVVATVLADENGASVASFLPTSIPNWKR